MPTPTIQTLQFDPTVEGDKWVSPLFEFYKTGFDFAATVFTAKLRKKSTTGEIVHTFTISPIVPEEGYASFNLTLSTTETKALGVGHYVGDIVASNVNEGGPATALRFKLPIESRITT